MYKPVVRVLSGLPGSGKTTLAKTLPGLRVNLDDIRSMMGWNGPESWDKDKESVAIETMMSFVEAAVEKGHDVVVDNTHLTARLPGILRRRVGGRATFKALPIDTPLEECIKRDAERQRPVGEEAIRKMAKTASRWKLTDEYLNIWPVIEKVVADYTLPECIIVDLDGTLTVHQGTRGPYDVERCDEDILDDAVEAALFGYALTMASAGWDYRVIFMSGREGTESVRSKTHTWLRDHLALTDDYGDKGINYELHMRAESDTRPDFVVKYELFNEHVRNKYRVLFCMDDRDQVVRLWREMGLKCFQVNWGNF